MVVELRNNVQRISLEHTGGLVSVSVFQEDTCIMAITIYRWHYDHYLLLQQWVKGAHTISVDGRVAYTRVDWDDGGSWKHVRAGNDWYILTSALVDRLAAWASGEAELP